MKRSRGRIAVDINCPTALLLLHNVHVTQYFLTEMFFALAF